MATVLRDMMEAARAEAEAAGKLKGELDVAAGGHPAGIPETGADGKPLQHPAWVPKTGGEPPEFVKKMLAEQAKGGEVAGGAAHPGSAAGRGMRPGGGPAAAAYKERTGIQAPRIIAWEITRSCNLSCAHCRAAAEFGHYPGELSTEEMKAVIDDIASITNPILILTGGEPFMRPDIWEIIDYAHEKGCMPVIGTNGTIITEEIAQKMAEHGITRMSVSLDFPDAARHDTFRGQEGSFDEAIRGIKLAQDCGVGVQINTTVTKQNAETLEEILELSQELGAVAFHPFLLVPTGRGESLRDIELTPQEYEEVLTWAYYRQKTSPLHFKPTDSPQYYRIAHQKAREERRSAVLANGGNVDAAVESGGTGHPCAAHGFGESQLGAAAGVQHSPDSTSLPYHGRPATSEQAAYSSHTRGCLGGITFCFISHVGDVQPCGYFDMQLGNVKEQPFSEIWTNSEVFADLRNYSLLKGKCGACEYKGVCGGCRARALSATGDYMDEEPYCAYIPRSMREDGEADGSIPAFAAGLCPDPMVADATEAAEG